MPMVLQVSSNVYIHVQSSTMETNAIVNDIVDKIVTCGRVFRVPVLNYLVLGPQVGVLLSKILGKKAGHFSHLIQESLFTVEF